MTTKPARNVRLNPMTADECPAREATTVSGYTEVDLDAARVALNGHASNDTAQKLYKSLGYGFTNMHMRLAL